MAVPGYQPAPGGGTTPKGINDAADRAWVQRIAIVVNNILQGNINVTLPITLTASVATTTIVDARISGFSAFVFTPVTAHAAAELATGNLYVSSQQGGQMTITHTNNAQVDRSFTLAILG